MTELRTIEIDFEVHKRIELERQNFAETPNAVLRRLLKIGGRAASRAKARRRGHAWVGKGVILPHGTELRMKYNGRVHTGVIKDGAWLVERGLYKSPSAAAVAVARTKEGNRTSLDGWIYWQVKRPGDADWADISSLRLTNGA